MSRGRKRKYPGGTEVIPIAFSREVAARVKTLPNRSDFVNRATSVALAGIVVETIDYEKKQSRANILLLESALLEEKKRLSALEEQADIADRKRTASVQMRLDFLEKWMTLDRPKISDEFNLAYLGSRQDVLVECGWNSEEEALQWLKENAGRATR